MQQLYIKSLRENCKIPQLNTENEEGISWTELKAILRKQNSDPPVTLRHFKGCQVKAVVLNSSDSREPSFITHKQYAQLVSSSEGKPYTSSISEIRAELHELRRETVWLANSLFSAIGFGAFFFVVAFLRLSFITSAVIGLLMGILLFFIEVILLVIRSDR